VFSERLSLCGLGDDGGPGAVEILRSRFVQAGIPWSDSPVSSELAEFMGRLSRGNIRQFIRYTKKVLEVSARSGKNTPIEVNLAGETLVRYFEMLRLSPDERRILEYLRDRPSSSSDQGFCNVLGVSHTHISEKMKPFVDQGKANAVEGRQTKITYEATPFALALLSLLLYRE